MLFIVLFFSGLVIAILAASALIRGSKPTINLGGPTPDNARIKQEADDIERRIKDQSNNDKAEVENASGKGLVDLVRRRMFRR